MSPKPIPLPSLLPRVESLAASTAGPGMSTKIKGEEINSIHHHLLDLSQRLAECAEAASGPKTKRGRLVEVQLELDQLQFAFRALAEIVEGKTPRARGQNPLDALETWCRNNGMEDGMPKDLAEAVERALGGA